MRTTTHVFKQEGTDQRFNWGCAVASCYLPKTGAKQEDMFRHKNTHLRSVSTNSLSFYTHTHHNKVLEEKSLNAALHKRSIRIQRHTHRSTLIHTRLEECWHGEVVEEKRKRRKRRLETDWREGSEEGGTKQVRNWEDYVVKVKVDWVAAHSELERRMESEICIHNSFPAAVCICVCVC